jgi:hypothetical protein
LLLPVAFTKWKRRANASQLPDVISEPRFHVVWLVKALLYQFADSFLAGRSLVLDGCGVAIGTRRYFNRCSALVLVSPLVAANVSEHSD